MRDALRVAVMPEVFEIAERYLVEALSCLPLLPDDVPTFLVEGFPLSDLAQRYLGALLEGRRRKAGRLILDAFESGTPVADIYLNVFQPVQHEVGRLWQLNEISVAQEHYCTAATQLVMGQLYPHIFSGERAGRTFVAACIGGDLHEIGLRMVADFMEMAGWDTYYLGADVPTDAIVRTLAERGADVLGISVTMPFHLAAAERLIAAVRAREATRDVKILVGGMPFNALPMLWQKTGADGFARDAQQAVQVAVSLVELPAATV